MVTQLLQSCTYTRTYVYSTTSMCMICGFSYVMLCVPLSLPMQSRYNNIKTSLPRSRGDRGSRESDDDIEVYMLAHRHIHTPGKKHSRWSEFIVVTLIEALLYILSMPNTQRLGMLQGRHNPPSDCVVYCIPDFIFERACVYYSLELRITSHKLMGHG